MAAVTEALRYDFAPGPVLDALAQLQGMPKRRQELLDRIGATWKARAALTFRTSTDPWGDPWEEITHREGQPLVDTGVLRGSLDYQVDDDELVLGVRPEYAAIHQFGGRTGRNGATFIHARPYLPIDETGVDLPDSWASDMNQVVTDLLDEIFGGQPA